MRIPPCIYGYDSIVGNALHALRTIVYGKTWLVETREKYIVRVSERIQCVPYICVFASTYILDASSRRNDLKKAALLLCKAAFLILIAQQLVVSCHPIRV